MTEKQSDKRKMKHTISKPLLILSSGFCKKFGKITENCLYKHKQMYYNAINADR